MSDCDQVYREASKGCAQGEGGDRVGGHAVAIRESMSPNEVEAEQPADKARMAVQHELPGAVDRIEVKSPISECRL